MFVVYLKKIRAAMRIWIKRAGILLLIPFLLIIILSVLLYVPAFQDFAVRQAAYYAGQATGMRIGIERIRLSFPLNLRVQGVKVVENQLPTDTLFSLDELNIRIRPWPLFHKEVLVESVGFRNVQANTKDLLEGMEIKGFIGNFEAKADRISLSSERATLNRLELSDATVTLLLTDTTSQADTVASAPLNWFLDLQKVDLTRVALAMQMPQDTLRISGFITEAKLRNGKVDLGKASYGADSFELTASSLDYTANEEKAKKGFDPSHIGLSDIAIRLNALYYDSTSLSGTIKTFMLKERSGLEITRLEGAVHGKGNQLDVPALILETPYSRATLEAAIPYTVWNKGSQENMNLHLDAHFGKNDLLTLAGELPEDLLHAYPDKDLWINADVSGNQDLLKLKRVQVQLPGALDMQVNGKATSIADEKKRKGKIDLKVFSGNLDFLLAFLPVESRDNLAIPHHLLLRGDAELEGEQYRTRLLLQDGVGKIRLQAAYHAKEERYKAHLSVDSLEPVHFLPHDSLYWMSASVNAEGKGLNMFDSLTWAKVDVRVADLRYGRSSVSDIRLEGSLENQLAKVDLISHYPLAQMDISLNASVKQDNLKAKLIADMQHLDFEGLHLSDNPFSTSFQLVAEAETDLKDKYIADLTLGDWELVSGKYKAHPKTLVVKARTHSDSTFVSFHAGDLSLTLTGNSGINGLSQSFNHISAEMDRQMAKDSIVRLALIRPMLPNLHLELNAKKDNPVYAFAQMYNIDFQRLDLNAYTSPVTGIRMDARAYKLLRDTFLLDTIQMRVWQDTVGIFYQAEVIKNKFKQQTPFSMDLSGQLQTGFMDALLQYKNEKGDTGILFGLKVGKEEGGGMNINFFPENPIFAFNRFTLNPDNYIIIKDEKNIRADVSLQGGDGAFLDIQSKETPEGWNEIDMALGQVSLDEISKGFSAYLPDISGMFNADIQYMPSDSSYTMTAGFNIDSLHYEGGRVGDLLFSAVYLPLADNEHQVDMHLFHDTREILTSSVYYQSGKQENIDGTCTVSSLPLSMLNPFIPEGMAQLKGNLQGEMTLAGTTNLPDIQGYLRMDSANLYLVPANTAIQFEPKDIKIHDNRIWFDKYSLYANGKNPFVIDGTVDFTNMSAMTADLALGARNMQLLSTKRTKNSLVYGKVFVNLSSSIRGPLNALVMRGDLDLLGGTNVTYVLQDSPLTVQDRLSGLVTFTSFDEDTLLRRRPRASSMPLGGMDMLMTIHIDQAVQANVDLSPDQSSHVNLEGGGDLSFQYTPMGDMFLNGRYTLSSGTIKYSLPVIPLKEFNVENGSYVQWTGNPMDPTMHITATERIRTSVTLDDQSSRMVNFDVGIELSQQLENLGLKFILEAPEDASMQEQLARMGEEEQAKQAVSMLVTGMYLGSGTTTGKANLDMGAALNSFLQNEINNIAGSALKSVDINFGMESYDDNGDGNKRTDYSFRFAKRFYNDRIRIVLGGRISTGAEINQGQAQPFIDNISIEYRLDPSGTRYVKIFHNKDYESLLEGELTETGAGIVLHKKMQHMRELFIFKRNKVKPVDEDEKNKENEKEK